MGEVIRDWTTVLARRASVLGAVMSLLVSLFITTVGLAVVLLVPFSSSNRDIAVGDVFAGGIFLLAMVAAVVAVLAYAQSSRKPRLATACSFVSLRDGGLLDEFARAAGIRDFTDPLPASVSDRGDLVPLEHVRLELVVKNHGQVAANNVLVALYLDGIYFSPHPPTAPGSGWKLFSEEKGSRLQWEPDRPVHAGSIPRCPSIDLTGMWAAPDMMDPDWRELITAADYLKQPTRGPLRIPAIPLSVPAGSAGIAAPVAQLGPDSEGSQTE